MLLVRVGCGGGGSGRRLGLRRMSRAYRGACAVIRAWHAALWGYVTSIAHLPPPPHCLSPATRRLPQATLQWRKEESVDTVLTDFEFTERPQFNLYYPEAFYGVDRAGRPVYVQQPGKVRGTGGLRSGRGSGLRVGCAIVRVLALFPMLHRCIPARLLSYHACLRPTCCCRSTRSSCGSSRRWSGRCGTTCSSRSGTGASSPPPAASSRGACATPRWCSSTWRVSEECVCVGGGGGGGRGAAGVCQRGG